MTKCRHVLLPFLLVLILPTFVFAGVTGKIRGMVRDAANGDPLPGVNVIVSHTWNEGKEFEFSGNLGAATDINGEYIILRVPPGRYSLTAQMMGYSPTTVQRVQVSVDRTIQVDFNLKQTVIQGQEIVVESKRDIIQLDVSATESYVTEEQYQTTPFANRIEDVIGMQSGVSGNVIEGTIKIREGEAHELGYLMDGMEITDKKFNRPVMSIQPGMVQEI